EPRRARRDERHRAEDLPRSEDQPEVARVSEVLHPGHDRRRPREAREASREEVEREDRSRRPVTNRLCLAEAHRRPPGRGSFSRCLQEHDARAPARSTRTTVSRPEIARPGPEFVRSAAGRAANTEEYSECALWRGSCGARARPRKG